MSILPHIRNGKSSRGFSLVEIIMVILIVSILAFFSVSSFDGLTKSTRLESVSQMVVGILNQARQTAISQNRMVEVRLYKLSLGGSKAVEFSAIKAFVIQDDNSWLPLTQLMVFPQGMIASGDLTLSNWTESPTTALSNEIPGQDGVRYNYLQFRPNGATSPESANPEKLWTLVLMDFKDLLQKKGLPKNFSAVSVHSLTGQVQVYRP